jgi:hypothetical protein
MRTQLFIFEDDYLLADLLPGWWAQVRHYMGSLCSR